MLFEVEVHSELRAFLRAQEKPYWPHHLTMARLVARALRLGRPALIQTGTSTGRYSLSYLTPALLSREPVTLVASQSVQPRLLEEMQTLGQRLKTPKEIRVGDRWTDFEGILLTTPQSWLADRLGLQQRFPAGIPTLIEGADDLETWAREQLEAHFSPLDWEHLLHHAPGYAELIRDVRVQLTFSIFARPQNPYGCCLIEEPEQERLKQLFQTLAEVNQLNLIAQHFWQQWQTDGQILWATVARQSGQFTLHLSPGEVATAIKPIWSQQPVVLMGSFLDWEADAPIYRQQLGLEDILCLKFSPDRQSEHIQLYLPERLPMPNTPQFQGAILEQIHRLIQLSRPTNLIVLLVDDMPLKAQVGATMAAEFGSRVQVESLHLSDNGILVSGWQFWRTYQEQLPTPQLLVIATLPLPSLENPLVAGRVAYYKRQRQDWFRLYLLPTALREIGRAILPIRESQGLVALLDNRVNHRSYGSQILSALEPCARINYLDPSWFGL